MLLGMVVFLVAAALVLVYVPSANAFIVFKWSLAHSVAAIIVDGLITIGTAVYLHSHKLGFQSYVYRGYPQPLGRTTWQSALPPAVCVCINTVLTEAFKSCLTQISMNTVLPKLYAISLMYTLNMRKDLRPGSRDSEPSTGAQITLAVKHASVEPHAHGFFRNASASIGAVEAGNGTRDERQGTGFLGGHTLNFSRRLDLAGRRVDDVSVETHVATDVGMSSKLGSKNETEMRSFQGDEDKEDQRDSEGDNDIWIQKL